MYDGTLKAGASVVKFKADLENKNPALRDFSIARVNEEPHARVQKQYRVWPMMNLCVTIDDYLMKLTHVIRGKDHETNTELQKMIQKALGFPTPTYYHIGRIKFEDVELSKTKLTAAIENGEFSGWDDPRVPSILSHKRRGYTAQAFRDMVLAKGISKRDSVLTQEEFYKALNFHNKQILEKIADRFFFVHNPKTVHITNISAFKDKQITLPKHPEDKSRGNRTFPVEQEYLIDGYDFNELIEGHVFRLMHFANVKVISKTEDLLTVEIVSVEFDKTLKIERNIHFLPKTHNKKAVIVLQDNSHLKGFVEDMHNPKEGGHFQFERFGFVRFDRRENGEKFFYFTHK
jgi:glutamyl-tRNA synthetase